MSVLNDHFRLTLLRLLKGAPGYTSNSSILHSATAEFGLVTSRDQIKTELAWLAEQGLVTTREVGGLVVVELTERGMDVADGRATQPGVQRPSPAH